MLDVDIRDMISGEVGGWSPTSEWAGKGNEADERNGERAERGYIARSGLYREIDRKERDPKEHKTETAGKVDEITETD